MSGTRDEIKDRIAEVFEPLFGLTKAEAQTRADGFLRLALSRGWDLIIQPSWHQTKAVTPTTAEVLDTLNIITRRLIALEAQPRTNALAGTLDALEARFQRATNTLRESTSDAISELAGRATDNETHDRDFDARLNGFARELSAMREDIRKCAELVANSGQTSPATETMRMRVDNLEKRVNEIGVDHLNTGEALTKLESLLQDAVTQRLGDALPALEGRLQEVERFAGQLYNKSEAARSRSIEHGQKSDDLEQRLRVLENWARAAEANGYGR